jgi:hypothetical protein
VITQSSTKEGPVTAGGFSPGVPLGYCCLGMCGDDQIWPPAPLDG